MTEFEAPESTRALTGWLSMWFPCIFAANGRFLKFATSPPIGGDRLSFPLDLATGWKFGMESVIGTSCGLLVIFLELDWVIFVGWVRRIWRYFHIRLECYSFYDCCVDSRLIFLGVRGSRERPIRAFRSESSAPRVSLSLCLVLRRWHNHW
ncbi:hypothetical protein TNIN_149551 [Trichonephila inaurata madagascariensis]|uniref:Uncharacterized protein n=1 Tax=Trichonephila inaurata madagascariensis TaxID=2747483 RepID=A0A8X6WM75_9ARAC|nr:hypothetical protein TNIN_149551 [Trichonephila inaurata madagascariensis]